MKVIDMHCDTIFEIARLNNEGQNIGLNNNQLNIDILQL